MKYLVFIGALAASYCASAITATKAYVDRRDAETLAAATNLVITSDEVMPGKGEYWYSLADDYGVNLYFEQYYSMLISPQYICVYDHMSGGIYAYFEPRGLTVNGRRYYESGISELSHGVPTYQMYFPEISQDETFAMRSDIERATNNIPQVVTNVVRDTQGLVYDEKLGITWKQTMYDGNLYYIAVTNANITEVK